MNAVASIEIPHPIEDVFAFITNVESMPGWVTGVERARLVSARMELGARYLLEYSGGWRTYELEAEVTSYESPRVFGSEVARGPFSFDGRLELEATSAGTKVTSVVEAGQESLSTRLAMVLFGALIRRSMERRLLRELRALQATMQGTSAADR